MLPFITQRVKKFYNALRHNIPLPEASGHASKKPGRHIYSTNARDGKEKRKNRLLSPDNSSFRCEILMETDILLPKFQIFTKTQMQPI